MFCSPRSDYRKTKACSQQGRQALVKVITFSHILGPFPADPHPHPSLAGLHDDYVGGLSEMLASSSSLKVRE